MKRTLAASAVAAFGLVMALSAPIQAQDDYARHDRDWTWRHAQEEHETSQVYVDGPPIIVSPFVPYGRYRSFADQPAGNFFHAPPPRDWSERPTSGLRKLSCGGKPEC